MIITFVPVPRVFYADAKKKLGRPAEQLGVRNRLIPSAYLLQIPQKYRKGLRRRLDSQMRRSVRKIAGTWVNPRMVARFAEGFTALLVVYQREILIRIDIK